MIYKIKDDYYIYRDRKYIKIDAKLEKGEVILIPNGDDFIEDNNNVHAESLTLDEIKKDLEKSHNTNNKKSSDDDTREIGRNRYSR